MAWLTNSSILGAGILLALSRCWPPCPGCGPSTRRGSTAAAATRARSATPSSPSLGARPRVRRVPRLQGRDAASLRWYGRVYGAVLHLQLLIDLFILLAAAASCCVWPKGGAVALAAFREGCRQPMFWLITVVRRRRSSGSSVVIPYFTFGDDYKMMKQIGFDVVMLAAVLFGVLAASMSISEEIEGRTAVTLMSKPVNRRQFLIGKFLGILMACVAMSLILGWSLNCALLAMPEFDKINEAESTRCRMQAQATFVPAFVEARAAAAAAEGRRRGCRRCGSPTPFAHSVRRRPRVRPGDDPGRDRVGPGHAAAVRRQPRPRACSSTSWATSRPWSCGSTGSAGRPGGTAVGLVGFLGQLFDVLLPALEFFNMGPAIIRETPLDLWQFARVRR